MDGETTYLMIQAALREVRTCMPGMVESYDADKQTVDVVPQLKNAYPDGEGDVSYVEHPKLSNVPVCFPRAGGFFMSFPIQKGDFVLLVFSERSIQAWREKGQTVEPGDRRLFPLDGAVAIPGVFPAAQTLADADGTNMMLGRDGTPGAQIKLTPTQVHLGGGAQFVALANLVATELGKVKATLDSLSGATFTVSYATPGSVAAQNVKAT